MLWSRKKKLKHCAYKVDYVVCGARICYFFHQDIYVDAKMLAVLLFLRLDNDLGSQNGYCIQ